MRVHATDFLRLDDMLSAEERLVRDTVRDFVQAEVVPVIADHFERGVFPRHLVERLGELGVLGSTLPEAYGCAGSSYVIYGLINQELERGDSGVRSFNSVQSSLVMFPIFEYGSEEQKRTWLPELARARKVG